jgi:AraC-like DNA-binding protein
MKGATGKYEKSALTKKMADEYVRRLIQFMDSHKPFLDPNLTLPKLAGQVSIRTHHLSQIINERLHESFFDFINRYRIEEAKKRLSDPSLSHYSIMGVANEVGFRSKSVFNSAFKKQTGMTPSEFRDAKSRT